MKKLSLTLPLFLSLAAACSGPAPDATAAAADPLNAGQDLLARNAGAFVRARGTSLEVNGQPFRFVGLNQYNLAGGPGASRCYVDHDRAKWSADLEDSLAQMHRLGATVARFWAYQNYAGASGHDFALFDHVVARAKAHGLRVVMTLEDQWAYCSPPAEGKTAAWYAGGYRQHYGYPLTYPEYVAKIVEHFAGEPTILMWQMMNEMESTDAAELRAFVHHIGGLIKSIDRNHLVNPGTLACGQHGVSGEDYRLLHEDVHVDVLEAHDYGAEREALPGCVAADLAVARALHKPFFVGEAGIEVPKFSRDERARLFDQKLRAAAREGFAGFMLWSFERGSDYSWGVNATSGDPLAGVLERDARLF